MVINNKIHTEPNFSGSIAVTYGDTPYVNNLNVSSKSESNKKQKGIWYVTPTTFLKIDDDFAKLYIHTKNKILGTAIIEYNPIYSGGMFISRNFIDFKNQVIEFKYDNINNTMQLHYTNNVTNENHILNMTKLTNPLCQIIINKIKRSPNISEENVELFLNILYD